MRNVIEIEGHKAVVSLDPEIGMFRGEFLGLNGGADFYSDSLDGLMSEGQKSLQTFLEICKEKGIEPFRSFSGRFNVRLDPRTHEAAVIAATANDQSLNEWLAETIATAARS
ncbi:Toxin-antitoxin systems (TAS) HicB (plasmid) [Neorhizobium galegae bv. officinalis bv. officinalis str. HAMBI 1141]|uniref:Toxin-antitoxin systems (TAS) HicB n=1 Tax=Neorhizobium galegae bv. officinalis bv. officinalis str. HAMBI 1141 TaxID=1028801 RepID=A0A068THI4_NEOGA|nr:MULTISPECIES: type II toxin-antitoxin system HicB family antitoxin [Neorhizobium]MCJ9674441.1 type II toxin-antitoxin system HicB family antitoxin [Neorhizobium sp. SHOUNA12B]MCJ9747232.1 type II toxin-antitoxin system HicB family antitoxin [Neorhizobium sp. SHOUNA12A]CDN56950.1 Toxin-antitoxin systems (TAS) HicB [Neorhizobium galegae bv. officinalis bv. officinalis str. HAMBI 1141]